MENINQDKSWKNDLITVVKAKNPNAALIAAPTSMGKTQQSILAKKVKELKTNS